MSAKPAGWLRGVLTSADVPKTHNGLVRDGVPTTVGEILNEADKLASRINDRTPDELERMRMCELHASIILSGAQIKYHADEADRISEERLAAQEELKTIMARLGIQTQ